jgi:two-component sensor histidine kinase
VLKFRVFFGVFAVLIALSCPAQQEFDSLKSLLKRGTNDAHTLSLIGRVFFEKGKYDSALYYYRASLREKNTAHDLPMLASSYSGIGTIFNVTGSMDSGAYYYKAALTIYDSLHDAGNATSMQSNLAILYKNIGFYDKALEYAFNALEYLENQPPDRALASCYNTIALVYTNLGDIGQSIRYHYKALNIRRQIGYDRGIGQSYNNIGDAYLAVNSYDSALSNLLRALAIKKNIGEQAPATLSNLGEVYLKLNQPSLAADYLNAALTIRIEQNDRAGQAMVLNKLAQLGLQQQTLAEVERLLDRSEILARQAGALEQLKRNLELRVEFFERRKDFPKALRYSRQLLVVRDSLLNRDKAQSLQAMQTRYETEKKEEQIDLLQKQKDFQDIALSASGKEIRNLYVFAFLLVVILLLIFNLYRVSRNSKRRVELLLQELNHRVKNNLQILSSILTLQAEQLTDERAVQAVKSNEGRVNAMALIHQKFMTQDGNQLVNLEEYIRELVDYLKTSYGFADRPINIRMNISPLNVDPDKAIPIGLMVNELVSNVFKHAFQHEPNPELVITLSDEPGNRLLLAVSDNGSGMSEKSSSSSSFGMKMIHMLVRQLNGRVQQKVSAGTEIRIDFSL